MKKKLLFFLVLICMAATSIAQPILIPSDQPTIQAGIDAASDGDTILVSEGTYYENINFLGKPITVASMFILDGDTSHISKTIIDGSQPTNPDAASTVIMVSGEDITSVLTGFTVTGGTGTRYYMSHDESSRRGGGGIFIHGSGGKIEQNIITRNHLEYDETVDVNTGGGVCAVVFNNHTAIIRNNNIKENLIYGVNSHGGGLAAISGRIICENNSISSNAVHSVYWALGGGVNYEYVSTMYGIIPEAIFRNNVIFLDSMYTDGDEWLGGGGGMAFHSPNNTKNLQVFNNIIYHNYARLGSGIVAFNSSGCIFNNTIADNRSEDIYGTESNVGVVWSMGTLLFYNNIVWSSEDPSLPDVFLYDTQSTDLYIINNIVGNQTAMWEGVTAYDNWNEDPLFQPDSYELGENSPGIGRGLDSIQIAYNWFYAPDKDFYGNPRPDTVDYTVDLGAIEAAVSPTSIGPFDGSCETGGGLIEIFPNPTVAVLNIDADVSATHYISIQSLNGQAVFQTRIEGTSGQIDLSSLQKGVYFITIRSKDFVTTRKIIKL